MSCTEIAESVPTPSATVELDDPLEAED